MSCTYTRKLDRRCPDCSGELRESGNSKGGWEFGELPKYYPQIVWCVGTEHTCQKCNLLHRHPCGYKEKLDK